MKKIPKMRIRRKNQQYFPQFKGFIFWRYFINRKRTISDSWDETVWFDTPYRATQFLKEAVDNLLNKSEDVIQIAEVDEKDLKGIFIRPNNETGFSAIMRDDLATLNLKGGFS